MGTPSLHRARTQLGIVLAGLLIIAGAAALITYLGIQDHNQDYARMALIDSQRELLLKQSWLALADPQNPEFVVQVSEFQDNLQILRSGGEAVSLAEELETIPPATRDPIVLAKLDATVAAWQSFRADAQTLWSLPLTAPSRSEAIRDLRASTSALARDLTELHNTYQHHMEADVGQLRDRLVFALLGVFPLLIWGYAIIRRRIVRPAAILTAAVRPAGRRQSVPDLSQEAYDDEILQLLPFFVATQPEISAANKWVESQISARTQLLMSAFKLSREIVGQPDLNPVLRLTADKAMELLGAHSAAICLFESETTYLELALAQGKVAARIGLQAAASVGHPIQIINLVNDASCAGSCAGCSFHQASGCAHHMSTTLQVGDRTVGSLCIVRDQDRPFDQNDQQALALLGSVAAVAISNAQVAQSSRYSTQQSAIFAERKRLTAEIHDSLAQTLSYLNLRVERATQLVSASHSDSALVEIEGIRSVARDAYTQVRAVLNNLHEPEPQTTTSMLDALVTFCADFRRATNLAVEVDIAEAEVDRLAPLVQAQVLNIVREALTNVQRHARATHVSVRAMRAPGSVCFAIADNGVGFDGAGPRRRDSFGLAIMQARAERSGGSLAIQSEAGKGTIISVTVPLSNARRRSVGAGDGGHTGRMGLSASIDSRI